MSGQMLEAAQTFLYGNARLLERHLFAFLFKDGDPGQVRRALVAYQNPNGGFGNALEPDKRTPTSQPIDQELALSLLDEIGFDPQIALQVCDFLETITTPEGGVPFTLRTVQDAPRAPWWDTDLEQPPASINPTASIAGLLHKNGVQHPWLERATEYCWRQIEEGQISGAHDFLAIQGFLQHIPDRARAERVFTRASAQLIDGGHVLYDPYATEYGIMPLTFAPSPHTMSARLFEAAIIQQHLEALAAKQQPDGGWPITWQPISPGCELEYRGIVTVGALKTLRAYGVLPA